MDGRDSPITIIDTKVDQVTTIGIRIRIEGLVISTEETEAVITILVQMLANQTIALSTERGLSSMRTTQITPKGTKTF